MCLENVRGQEWKEESGQFRGYSGILARDDGDPNQSVGGKVVRSR